VRVALTIDTEHPDRPCRPDNPERIAGLLREQGVRASFFVQGRWASAHPGVARGLAADGHVIGNHSKAHGPMTDLTDDGVRATIAEAGEAIAEAAGVDPRPWFRCPYGDGMDDARILGLIRELGYRHVGWDVDPRDWDETRTVDELVKFVVAGDGIVLLHAWPTVTADALGRVIAGLRDRGADLVGIDELV
jgi:peptidoglycan/xylan/chitin deacetylase (PgdA/CDA1 family)